VKTNHTTMSVERSRCTAANATVTADVISAVE